MHPTGQNQTLRKPTAGEWPADNFPLRRPGICAGTSTPLARRRPFRRGSGTCLQAELLLNLVDPVEVRPEQAPSERAKESQLALAVRDGPGPDLRLVEDCLELLDLGA